MYWLDPVEQKPCHVQIMLKAKACTDIKLEVLESLNSIEKTEPNF